MTLMSKPEGVSSTMTKVEIAKDTYPFANVKSF